MYGRKEGQRERTEDSSDPQPRLASAHPTYQHVRCCVQLKVAVHRSDGGDDW
jgi:hypothetical protein